MRSIYVSLRSITSLPASVRCYWTVKAILAGKHVLSETPSASRHINEMALEWSRYNLGGFIGIRNGGFRNGGFLDGGFKYFLFSPRTSGFHDPIWLAHRFQLGWNHQLVIQWSANESHWWMMKNMFLVEKLLFVVVQVVQIILDECRHGCFCKSMIHLLLYAPLFNYILTATSILKSPTCLHHLSMGDF